MSNDLMIKDNQVIALTTQVSEIVSTADSLIVNDENDYITATDLLSLISKINKKLEEKRKELVKPYNEQVKKINDFFKGYTEPLDRANRTVKQKALTYKQDQERKRQEEERAIREALEKARKEAESQNKEVDIPAAETVVIPKLIPTVRAGLGTSTVKKVWTFAIEDETKIPREYLMVNEKKIREAIRKGIREIPGVRIYQEEELAVRAR